LALLVALALATACGGGEPAVPPATPTVTPIPPTPVPTPIPFTYNPDYPVYKTPQSDLDLLGAERIEQIRQVHRLLSEPLQRRLDAWGANFTVAPTIEELMALPEYTGESLPTGHAIYFGVSLGNNRTYGVITDLPQSASFQGSYGHELGHIIYGLLNEDGITENAKYYLRTTVGTGEVCPVRGVKHQDMESILDRIKANPNIPINSSDYGDIGAKELAESIDAFNYCRHYLSTSGAIGANSQYTGGIILNLSPRTSGNNRQTVSIALDQSGRTATTLYAPSPLALWNPDEFFAEGVMIVIGGILGADYATVGESYSPLENFKTYNPEYFSFIEGLLTNPDVANQFMLSEQELLEIRYRPQ
jgi:hypothetical protein